MNVIQLNRGSASSRKKQSDKSGIIAALDVGSTKVSCLIGEVKGDGQFNIVWKTPTVIRAKPWSPYIPGNDGKPDQVM